LLKRKTTNLQTKSSVLFVTPTANQ